MTQQHLDFNRFVNFLAGKQQKKNAELLLNIIGDNPAFASAAALDKHWPDVLDNGISSAAQEALAWIEAVTLRKNISFADLIRNHHVQFGNLAHLHWMVAVREKGNRIWPHKNVLQQEAKTKNALNYYFMTHYGQ